MPGIEDVNDQSVEGWIKSTLPLYLWSRPDWTKKHKKVAEEHNHINMGMLVCRTEEGNLSGDILAKKDTKSSYVPDSRSGRKKQNIGKTSCNPREVIPVQSQAKAEKSKQNGRSVKAKETREKIACDVREVSPTDKEKESTSCYVREVTRSDEPLVKKRNISVEEKAKAACHVNLARSGEEKTTSCYVREVTRSDEPLVPLSPGVLFPTQVVFSSS